MITTSRANAAARFLRSLDNADQILSLFDQLPHAYFYMKTAESCFVKVNAAMCSIMGVADERALLGHTDRDFFPPELAEKYIAEDRLVMRRRQPLLNQIWLVPSSDGTLRWYVSSKIPLLGRGGKALGIAGIMRDFEHAGALLGPYQCMAPVVRYIERYFSEAVETGTLARLIHLSVSQFERRFRAVFHLTPMQYLLRVRISAACKALVSSDTSLAHIADACGFYDQAHFTRQFRTVMRLTPSAYRRSLGSS